REETARNGPASLRNDQRPLAKKDIGTTLAPPPAFILLEHLCNGVLQYRTMITTAWNAIVLRLSVSTNNRLTTDQGGAGRSCRFHSALSFPSGMPGVLQLVKAHKNTRQLNLTSAGESSAITPSTET
ncbi:unnamed protein product, partial [Ectocarpus sp. 13 AM-2016]